MEERTRRSEESVEGERERAKATWTAKTTRFNEKVDTSKTGERSGGERTESLERRVRSPPRSTYTRTARPYFNREIKMKRGKEGWYKARREMDERERGGEREKDDARERS